MTEREKAVSQAYLEKAAAAPGSVKTESGLIYRELAAGAGASPKGDYPFIDTMDLKTGLKKRIWQCPEMRARPWPRGGPSWRSTS